MFITRLPVPPTGGPRLAVKDLIDVAGVVATAGCRAVADHARPAEVDAACLAGARGAGARIVGTTTLVELAYGAHGVNDVYGTPVNPLDPARTPGGSSSGSAVAVATGAADVAYGTDTGGSVRIPAACTGTVGLKTTRGRVPLVGVRPLFTEFDTVGPMGADITATALGWSWLAPDSTRVKLHAPRIGRLRGHPAAPAVDAALDAALVASGCEVVDVSWPAYAVGHAGARVIFGAGAAAQNAALLHQYPAEIAPRVTAGIKAGLAIDPVEVTTARLAVRRASDQLDALLETVDAVALPTLRDLPPLMGEAISADLTAYTTLLNATGHPALALPVPYGDAMPAVVTRARQKPARSATPNITVVTRARQRPARSATTPSLQLVGPHDSEEFLLALGALVEAGVRSAGPARAGSRSG